MRILYIEDNAVNLALIQRIAKMHEHHLISVDNAEEGLEIVEKDKGINLILLDIQLAGEMDGVDFAKTIRARGDQRPIIAITAYAMVGDKERILAAGCNEYLPKPLPIAEFISLLAKYDPANQKTADHLAETQPIKVPKPDEEPKEPNPSEITRPIRVLAEPPKPDEAEKTQDTPPRASTEPRPLTTPPPQKTTKPVKPENENTTEQPSEKPSEQPSEESSKVSITASEKKDE